MKEVVHSIGNNPRLVGVYTNSDLTESASASCEHKPTILLLNSGFVPNTGPFRLYVELARTFAEVGFNTFRFDFSGIGDSSQGNTQRLESLRHLKERNLAELKAVMDFLEEKHNDHQFILMGICSGALNAHHGMTRDTRVIGAVCIDGYIYKTLKYHIHLYGPKLFSLKSWINLLKRIPKTIKSFRVTVPGEHQHTQEDSPFEYSMQPREATETDFKQFIDRGVPLYCIFTRSWCLYKNQLADSFKNIDFGENIEVTYLRNTQHIFPLMEDQQHLSTVIVDWLNRKFRPQ